MDESTRIALEGSIKKWEAIVDGTGIDAGQDNCPLCQKFFKEDVETGHKCGGCPVKEESGEDGCRNTPYIYFDEDDADSGQAELDFLISLRPNFEEDR